jgi:integrase
MKTPPTRPPSEGAATAESALVLTTVVPSNALATTAPLPPEVVEELREHVQASRAENTLKSYAQDWSSFTAWAERLKQPTLPSTPEAVAAYLSQLAKDGKALATLLRHRSTISRRHTLAGIRKEDNPTRTPLVQSVIDSVGRKKGAKQDQKEPLTLDELKRLLSKVPVNGLTGFRDRAMLLTGFHGAFRGSELAALRVEDLAWSPDGVVVTVRKSKTDQIGKGTKKPLRFTNDEFCAPTAIQAWMHAAQLTSAWGVTSGSLFRPIHRSGALQARHFTGTVVSNVIKGYCEAAGLDPERFASHSLRAGYVTQSLDDGASPYDITRMTGHTSTKMIERYDRRHLRDPFAGVHTPKGKK